MPRTRHGPIGGAAFPDLAEMRGRRARREAASTLAMVAIVAGLLLLTIIVLRTAVAIVGWVGATIGVPALFASPNVLALLLGWLG